MTRDFSRSFPIDFKVKLPAILFIVIWACYFLFFVVFHFDNIRGSLAIAFAYQLSFVVVSVLPLLFLLGRSKEIELRYINKGEAILIFILFTINLFADASLFYDKFLQGIDYNNGICGAREQMTRLGKNRQGVSSVFSVFGQLFGYLYFATLPLIFMRNVSRSFFWSVVFVSLSIMLLHSFISASRFASVFFILFLVSLSAIRLSLSKFPQLRVIDFLFSGLILFCVSMFILNVFACRSSFSNLTTKEYAESFESHLFMPPSKSLVTEEPPKEGNKIPVSNGVLDKFAGLLEVTKSYAFHSGFVFSAIIDLDENNRKGILSFEVPLSLLAKVGLDYQGEYNQSIAGRFPSLPGTIYYDGGLTGLLAFSAACALLLGGVVHLKRKHPHSYVLWSVFTLILVTMYVSPVILSTSVMALPFIVYALVIGAVSTLALEAVQRKRKPDAFELE